MGLSASQARFLQLTARRSNVEYQAQQINFERLQWSDKLSIASQEYQNKVSNRIMVYSFNNGAGVQDVDVTYTNYKNYMNQQMKGLTTSQDKLFLVSSSGNKIVVASEEERDAMIEANTRVIKIEIPQEETPVAGTNDTNNGTEGETSSTEGGTAGTEDVTGGTEDGAGDENPSSEEDTTPKMPTYKEEIVPIFTPDDFIIAPDLDDVNNFQDAIRNGVYFFAKLGENSETNEPMLRSESWDVIGGGAISDELNKADDAAAEAEFEAIESKIQNIDKKLELQLSKLETERSAIQTEIDSISKVIDDNIESSFKVFS